MERVHYYMDIAALELLEAEPDIVQPLHVVTKVGRKPQPQRFSGKRHVPAADVPGRGCYYGKMDLSDCFLSFPVHEDSRRLLAFQLVGKFYRFKRLPFGLSSAPLWCHRFMEVVDFELRRLGSRFVRYTDDFLLLGTSPAEVRQAMLVTQRVLEEHGSAQQMVFLGLELDSVAQTARVPADKASELKSIIGSVSTADSCSRFQLQSLVGKFSFAASALPGARPFFRHLVDATRDLKHKFSRTPLTGSMRCLAAVLANVERQCEVECG
jgi:hypothetical protein